MVDDDDSLPVCAICARHTRHLRHCTATVPQATSELKCQGARGMWGDTHDKASHYATLLCRVVYMMHSLTLHAHVAPTLGTTRSAHEWSHQSHGWQIAIYRCVSTIEPIFLAHMHCYFPVQQNEQDCAPLHNNERTRTMLTCMFGKVHV